MPGLHQEPGWKGFWFLTVTFASTKKRSHYAGSDILFKTNIHGPNQKDCLLLAVRFALGNEDLICALKNELTEDIIGREMELLEV